MIRETRVLLPVPEDGVIICNLFLSVEYRRSSPYRPLSLFFRIVHQRALKIAKRDRKRGNSGGIPSGTDTYRLKKATSSESIAATPTIVPLTFLRRLTLGCGDGVVDFSGS